MSSKSPYNTLSGNTFPNAWLAIIGHITYNL